jgi:prevent-host-death family protein
MRTKIPHSELRNRSGEVLRRAEAGEELTITVGGRPVAHLGPVPRRQWLKKAEYLPILLAGRRDRSFMPCPSMPQSPALSRVSRMRSKAPAGSREHG